MASLTACMKASGFNRIILLKAPADCGFPLLNASVISKFTPCAAEMLKLDFVCITTFETVPTRDTCLESYLVFFFPLEITIAICKTMPWFRNYTKPHSLLFWLFPFLIHFLVSGQFPTTPSCFVQSEGYTRFWLWCTWTHGVLWHKIKLLLHVGKVMDQQQFSTVSGKSLLHCFPSENL